MVKGILKMNSGSSNASASVRSSIHSNSSNKHVRFSVENKKKQKGLHRELLKATYHDYWMNFIFFFLIYYKILKWNNWLIIEKKKIILFWNYGFEGLSYLYFSSSPRVVFASLFRQREKMLVRSRKCHCFISFWSEFCSCLISASFT